MEPTENLHLRAFKDKIAEIVFTTNRKTNNLALNYLKMYVFMLRLKSILSRFDSVHVSYVNQRRIRYWDRFSDCENNRGILNNLNEKGHFRSLTTLRFHCFHRWTP